MAKYTTELSNMLAAYASNLDVYENEQGFEIKDPLSNQKKFFKHHDFSFLKLNSPNWLIKNFGPMYIKSRVTDIPHNFTDDEDINNAILDKFLETFVRHFYGYEIGQENVLYWFVILQAYLDEHMPFFIQEYRKLMIEQLQWTTNEGKAVGNAVANANQVSNSKDDSVTAQASVPEDELEFRFESANPAETYNFRYASGVNGGKSENNSTSRQDSTQDTVQTTTGRNMTIAQLTNELNSYSNGVYLEMFQRAKAMGLFMLKAS